MATKKLFPQDEYPVRWIPVSECEVVHTGAQRTEDARNVKRIAENFNPDMFGVITVANKNGINRYHVIDGQHRIAALKLMGYTDQLVPAVVREIHTARDAAEAFLGLNSARKPGAIAEFKTAVTAGRAAACEVDAIIQSLGFHVDTNASAPTVIAAVKALTSVHATHGPKVLRGALETIKATWPGERDAVHGAIIQGYGDLLAGHAHELDNRRLVSTVAKRHTAANILAAARASKGMYGGRVSENVVRVVAAAYNTGIKAAGRIRLD